MALLNELRSGYDVVLVADLAKLKSDLAQLPRSRGDLYKAMLQMLRLESGDVYPVLELGSVAWEMFLKGERRLLGSSLRSEWLVPLLDERSPVLRRVSSDVYEFRHDQMRAYLAARYLWAGIRPVELLLNYLSTSEVWRRRSDDQEELWTNFADGILDCDQLGLIWLFSLGEVEYVLLQHAVQTKGQQKGCAWAPPAATSPVSVEAPTQSGNR